MIARPAGQVPYSTSPFSSTTPPSPMDALLSSCPTEAEMRQIRSDFNITIDPSVPPSMLAWSCTNGGRESSVMLTLYNAFRAMKLLTFDAPMPLIGATNLYDWLRKLRLTFHVVGDAVTGGYNMAGGTDVYLLAGGMNDPTNRVWFDPLSAGGLSGLIGLLVHEARHTVPGGNYPHNCSNWDSTISFGGAWSLQYYFFLWCAQHAGAYLTDSQKTAAAGYADWIAHSHFCDAQRQAVESVAPHVSRGRSAMLADVATVDRIMGRSAVAATTAIPVAKRLRPAGQAQVVAPSSSLTSLLVVSGLALGAIAIFAATVSMDQR